MSEPELPSEAAEADVLEQHADVSTMPEEVHVAGEPSWEADPADVAEQGLAVDDDEDGYPDN